MRSLSKRHLLIGLALLFIILLGAARLVPLDKYQTGVCDTENKGKTYRLSVLNRQSLSKIKEQRPIMPVSPHDAPLIGACRETTPDMYKLYLL
jgi:hypothetical protein